MMKPFVRLLILFSLMQTLIHACMSDERLEPSDRWSSPDSMQFQLPTFSLELGQILVLHLPFENGKNRWKIPQSGENEEYRWYTEPRLTDQELRIQALKSGSILFKMKFESANKETRSAAILLNISTTGVSPEFSPLYLTRAHDGQQFENHPHSPVVVTLENPKVKIGVWKYRGNQNELSKKPESYKTSKGEKGTRFSFKNSFDSRTLKFEFIEKDGFNLFPIKAKFYLIPLKDIPAC